MNKVLTEILERAQAWPKDARDELEQLAREIEAEIGQGTYSAAAEELAGIDQGLKAADQGNFVADEDVEAIFTKHRQFVKHRQG